MFLDCFEIVLPLCLRALVIDGRRFWVISLVLFLQHFDLYREVLGQLLIYIWVLDNGENEGVLDFVFPLLFRCSCVN